MSLNLIFKVFSWLLGAAKIEQPKRKHVLIIEDEPTDAELLQMIVEKHGYTAHVCSTLNTALLALKDREWHRIYVDKNLGRTVTINQVQVLEGDIFTDEALAAVPSVKIVYVTGQTVSLVGTGLQFPCVLKGVGGAKFDHAIAATLASDDRPQELKRWKLFTYCVLLCLISAFIGMMSERFNWVGFLNSVKP